MSYCRWSTDNFECDIYAYEDVNGGYTLHVASSRFASKIPDASLSLKDIGKPGWLEQHKGRQAVIDASPLVAIGGEYDGLTFNEPDLDSFRSRLLQLREAGYAFPDYVLEVIEEEIKDEIGEDE